MTPARTTRAVVLVLLGVAVLLPLLVGTYDREEPALFGLPFFHWYQFALIPLTAVLTWVSFVLLSRQEARERAERQARRRRGGGPA